jgi:hypothetical protein
MSTEAAMDKNLARHVIRVAFRNSRQLQELLALLKERCSAEEYQDHAVAIAAAIDAINVALTNRALSSWPELAGEIEADLARFGRVVLGAPHE